MAKPIFKCPQYNRNLTAMTSGMWMCKNDGFSRDATQAEMKFWKLAHNKHGKQ